MEAVKVITQLKELKTFSRAVFKHCIGFVSPKNLVKKELAVIDGKLQIRGESYALHNNVYIIGFGKAVLEMGRAAELIIGQHVKAGILSIPEGTIEHEIPEQSQIKVFHGALNNLPDVKAENTSKRIAALVEPLTDNDLLLVLISGGGSALLPYPTPPVTIEEKRIVTEMLSKKGANIIELNSVRKQLSLFKGGKLAKLAFPARVISLIISDVINDKLEFIAAGPTVPDTTSSTIALDILKKYNLLDQVSQSVMEVLTKEFPEDMMDEFKHTSNYIIGNNRIALNAGCEMVIQSGAKCYIMSSCIEGPVADVALALAQLSTLICKMMARTISETAFTQETEKLKPVLCMESGPLNQLEVVLTSESLNKVVLLFGGETTVNVKGLGKGGRNQELALRFAAAIDEISSQDHVNRLFNVILLSGGTDGMDGPTDAAGAIGYNGLTQLAKEKNLSYHKFLNDNDSYNFFSSLDSGEDLIKIGHTGTNVMDVLILTIQSKE